MHEHTKYTKKGGQGQGSREIYLAGQAQGAGRRAQGAGRRAQTQRAGRL